MAMTKKIPVKELETQDVCSKVAECLRNDNQNAYTIAGLMVEIFGVKEEDIHNKSFSDWKKGLPSLYTRIRLCLEKLQKQEKVRSVKQGRAMLYHWIGNTQTFVIKRRE